MTRKYGRGIDMVDKPNRYINFGLFLLTVAALILVPQASATQEYFNALNSTYSSASNSCGICHQGGVGGAPRTAYGTLFENQANHVVDPAAALKTIGAPGGAVAELLITVPANMTQVATGNLTNVTLGTATTTGGNGTVNITNNAPTEGFIIGVTDVIWTAIDSTGATVTATQKVIVMAPAEQLAITPPANIAVVATGELTNITDLGVPTITGGTPPYNTINDAPIGGNFAVGDTIVTWTVNDSVNAVATAMQKITITAEGTGGKVSGKVFKDLNKDNELDGNELGIANMPVKLSGTGVSTKGIIMRTKTDANGNYQFLNLKPGRYVIHSKFKHGWVSTTRVTKVVLNLQNGETVTANFGKTENGNILTNGENVTANSGKTQNNIEKQGDIATDSAKKKNDIEKQGDVATTDSVKKKNKNTQEDDVTANSVKKKNDIEKQGDDVTTHSVKKKNKNTQEDDVTTHSVKKKNDIEKQGDDVTAHSVKKKNKNTKAY